MSSKNDLRVGATHNPELYRKILELERKTGYTMHMSRKPLDQLAGVEITGPPLPGMENMEARVAEQKAQEERRDQANTLEDEGDDYCR